jgi:hypothetical protein
MNLEVGNYNQYHFQEEMGYVAKEHPHLYLSWLQVKLTDKLCRDMEDINLRMKEMEYRLANTEK